jgi:malic enzyme
VIDHIDEMMPIVYTPTVGEACQKFSHIYRFPRGVFLSPENIGQVDEIFERLPCRDVAVIVVTDSAGILGIGDQGAGGMGIPIGKLSLYTAGAGINPANCLPVTLDVGTTTRGCSDDPLYLGVRRPRCAARSISDSLPTACPAVRRHFPTPLQWEDSSPRTTRHALLGLIPARCSFQRRHPKYGRGRPRESPAPCARRRAPARSGLRPRPAAAPPGSAALADPHRASSPRG